MTPARVVNSIGDAMTFIQSRVVTEMIRAGLCEIVIRPFKHKKSREQEKKFHAQIGDIARQYKFLEMYWHKDDMKRLLVHQFWSDTQDDPDLAGEWQRMNMRLAPSLDMKSIVLLGKQTRDFTVKLGSAFIEWLYAFGDTNGIQWSEPMPAEYSDYQKYMRAA